MSEDKIKRIDFRPAEQSAYRNAKRTHENFPFKSYVEFIAAVGSRPSPAHRMKVIDGLYQWTLKAVPVKPSKTVYEMANPEQLKTAMEVVRSRVDYSSVRLLDRKADAPQQNKELTRPEMEARIAELKRALGKSE